MAGVVGGLSSASRGACGDTVGEGLDLGEGEELVAHVGIGVRDWIIRCVDRPAELHRAAEARLRCWSSVLVVSIAARDDDLERI